MTLADIDKALAQWEDRLTSAAHNLFDLQNDPTYQCITGTGGAPKTPLTGVTASKVYPALENISTLFQCFDLLRCTIDRAVEIRRDLPSMFGTDQKEREIQQLLTGKSVRIPTNQIPMARRTLLSGADDQGCISPGELLTTMIKAFETARDGVMAVDAAWNALGTSVGDATRQIAALRAEPELFADAEMRELDGIDHALGLRRAQVQSDPLGTSLDLETAILPALQRLKNTADDRAESRRQTADGLVAGRAAVQEMRRLHREAADAWEEAREKITGAALSAPGSPARIEALDEWLHRLQEKFDGGMSRPVAIGLQNWNTASRDCVSELQKIHAASNSPLELRKELRGRLTALKAKALAFGVEEEADLRAVANEAEALLYNRPTPIDRAEELVGRYQSLLGGKKVK